MPKYARPHDPNLIRIRTKIQDYLRQRKLTQCGLAKDAKVKQYQVNRLLRGRTKRVTEDVKKICHYAGISIKHETINLSDNPRIQTALDKVSFGDSEVIEFVATVIEALAPVLAALRTQRRYHQ